MVSVSALYFDDAGSNPATGIHPIQFFLPNVYIVGHLILLANIVETCRAE